MKEKVVVLSSSLCASFMLNTEDKMAPSLLELMFKLGEEKPKNTK